MGLILVDKSAWVRGGPEMVGLGELCLCGITRMEILYSARSAGDYVALAEALAAYRDLRMDHATISAAESAQRELAAAGRHRIPLPDVLIGACAQQHAADVLHVDRHFDLLGKVMGFGSITLAAGPT